MNDEPPVIFGDGEQSRDFKILGKDIEPVYKDPRPGDIKHSLADISRARIFGYKPESDFKEELRETIKWFSNASI